jgi:hypothetical protein
MVENNKKEGVMKTFKLIMTIVLIVGLIGIFSAFSAEQNTKGKKEDSLTESQKSKDKQKGLTPGSTTMKAPAANLQSLPLTITRLYLKDGKVHVVIKRQGSDRLSDEDYANTKLKVEANTLIKPPEWTLLEVDPHKRLNQLIREKDFDTGLEVTERVRVTATLYRGLWKTAKEGTLSPMMAKVDVKTHKAAPGKKDTFRDQVLVERETPPGTAASEKKMLAPSTGSVRDGVSPPEPVLLYDDSGGIRITSPKTDDIIDFSRDSTEPITVIYRVTNPDIPAGNITFNLSKRFDDVRMTIVAETTISYVPPDVLFEELPLTLHWNVYEDMRGLPGCDGQYSIRAAHENGAWGKSDIFTIDCPGEGGFHGGADLELVYPPERGAEYVWDICGPIPVRFRIVGNYEAVPTRWLIRIFQVRDEEDRLITDDRFRARLEREMDCEDYEDVDAGSVPYRECSVSFSLRNEALACPLTCGTYRIAVYNVEWSYMYDQSGSFGVGICDVWQPFIVVVEREDIRIGDNINYHWSPRVFEATVHLMKGDEGEEEIIDTNEGCGDGPADSCGGSFPTASLDEGDDYKVRVINPANPDNWGDSRTFTVSP